jgi:hypothetical protein
MEKTKEIAIKENYSIEKIKDMTAMSSILKNHIVKQNLYTNIKGKNYAHVEGWQFAGGLMGLLPMVVEVKNMSEGIEKKWFVEVNIVDKEGNVKGKGFALCSNKEAIKESFDEYAVLSMAQTRAIGKAYRNLIGWVMKLAGYEGTPKEEMTKVGDTTIRETPVAEVKDEKVLVCQKCDGIMSKPESDFSKRIYKKQLCRDCQKELKQK